MPRLLVTGGTGYLGSELVRQASQNGWSVVATYHSQIPQNKLVEWRALDLRIPGTVNDIIAQLQPDVIIHTAYQQSGPDLEAVTVAGTTAVAEAARQHAARLIHLSSDVVFDGEQIGAYREDDLPVPITAYGQAKLAAERSVRSILPSALIIRTSLLYGGSRPSAHEQFVLETLAQQNPVTFFTDELRCPIQVGDLAAALLELAPQQRNGILHVAGSDTVSRHEFAQRVAHAHGRQWHLLQSGSSLASGQRRPRNCALDTALARSCLQTRLRGVREVLPF